MYSSSSPSSLPPPNLEEPETTQWRREQSSKQERGENSTDRALTSSASCLTCWPGQTWERLFSSKCSISMNTMDGICHWCEAVFKFENIGVLLYSERIELGDESEIGNRVKKNWTISLSSSKGQEKKNSWSACTLRPGAHHFEVSSSLFSFRSTISATTVYAVWWPWCWYLYSFLCHWLWRKEMHSRDPYDGYAE